MERYVYDPEEITFQLMREAVDPVTVIFDGAVGLAHNLIAEDGSVGIRIPKDKFCQDLLRSFPKPIVSTSANVSSAPSRILPRNRSRNSGQGRLCRRLPARRRHSSQALLHNQNLKRRSIQNIAEISTQTNDRQGRAKIKICSSRFGHLQHRHTAV